MMAQKKKPSAQLHALPTSAAHYGRKGCRDMWGGEVEVTLRWRGHGEGESEGCAAYNGKCISEVVGLVVKVL